MKLDIKKTCRNFMLSANAHKPELLTGAGVSLMLIAVPLAVVATIKACKKVEEKKEELAKDIQNQSGDNDTPVNKDDIEIPAKEVVKATWKYYIPAVVAAGLGAFCNVSSTREGLKRTAAMAAAYQLSESALSEWKKASQEVIGDKKQEEIRQKVMRNRMEQILDEDGHVQSVYDTRDGSTLCFDYWGGRFFYSDIDYIKSQINRVNETLLKESMSYDAFVSLNDVYRAIGLPDMGAGEDRVWRINKEGLIELKPYSILVDGDRPCWVLAFAKAPSVVQPWEMDRM